MQASALRKKLHELIDNSPEEKLMEVYSVFEGEYSDTFKAELDAEYEDYLQNPDDVVSKEALDTMVDKLLYGK